MGARGVYRDLQCPESYDATCLHSRSRMFRSRAASRGISRPEGSVNREILFAWEFQFSLRKPRIKFQTVNYVKFLILAS